MSDTRGEAQVRVLRTLRLLAGGPISVAEIARRLGVGPSASRRDLGTIRLAGLEITQERDGRRIRYSLDPRGLPAALLAIEVP